MFLQRFCAQTADPPRLCRAVMYRYRYVTDDGYDNHYLSELIKRVDDKREQQQKPTVLPLKTREMRRYIDVRLLPGGIPSCQDNREVEQLWSHPDFGASGAVYMAARPG